MVFCMCSSQSTSVVVLWTAFDEHCTCLLLPGRVPGAGGAAAACSRQAGQWRAVGGHHQGRVPYAGLRLHGARCFSGLQCLCPLACGYFGMCCWFIHNTARVSASSSCLMAFCLGSCVRHNYLLCCPLVIVCRCITHPHAEPCLGPNQVESCGFC